MVHVCRTCIRVHLQMFVVCVMYIDVHVSALVRVRVYTFTRVFFSLCLHAQEFICWYVRKSIKTYFDCAPARMRVYLLTCVHKCVFVCVREVIQCVFVCVLA